MEEIPERIEAEAVALTVDLLMPEELISLAAIIYRAFDLKTNMRNPLRFITYCIYNPLFSKETFKKQGLMLGLNEAQGVKDGAARHNNRG